jgi:predicted metal-dependent enzyme (double-stranded beta helix superfamily)
MSNLGRLRDFIADFTRLIDRAGNDEETILAEGRRAVAALVAADDWLPETCAQPHPQYYQQYLLHCDPLERFSVVSFVWGPGQATPVHDHTIWGIIGVLRGAELSRRFTRSESGGGPLVGHGQERLERGAVEAVSPTIGQAVQFAQRLVVQQEQARLVDQGARQGRTLRHAARKLMRVSAGETG